MAKRKVDAGTRVILATAAVVLGLAVGIVVVAVVNSQSDNGGPAAYQPFFAGQADRLKKQIEEGGPVCIPDPRAGERSFCLDIVGDEFVAYHVVQPGRTAECLVEWDRAAKRYEDQCSGAPVDPATLSRFPVLTKEIDEKISVFVDVRTSNPAS